MPTSHTTERSFLTESSQIFALAFPLIVGQLSQMFMGLTDTLMIGHLGVRELGAATLANTLFVVPLVLGVGLLSSVSVRISQANGANDPETGRRILRHGTWLAAVFGVVFAGLLIGTQYFLHDLRQDPEIVARTPGFLSLIAASLIPAVLAMTWKNHADALNRPWPPFWIMMSGVALNVLLNWLFIWGIWIFPAWGLEGAGVATLISRILTAVALLYWLKNDPRMQEWLPVSWFSRWEFRTFKNLLRIGLPASMQLLSEVGAFAAITLLIGTFSAQALAAHQIAINCASTAFMIPLGIGMAMTVKVGEIVGANQRTRLRKVLLGGWAFTMVFTSGSMGCFLVFGDWIACQFVDSGEVTQLAAKFLVIAGLFQIVDGIQVVSGCSLRGINDVTVPVWLTFVAYWVIAIPAGYLLGFKTPLGPVGLWWGLAFGLGVVSLFLAKRSWRLLGPKNTLQPSN